MYRDSNLLESCRSDLFQHVVVHRRDEEVVASLCSRAPLLPAHVEKAQERTARTPQRSAIADAPASYRLSSWKSQSVMRTLSVENQPGLDHRAVAANALACVALPTDRSFF